MPDSHVKLSINCPHSSYRVFCSLLSLTIAIWKLSSGCKWILVRIKGHLSNELLSNFIPHQCQELQNLFSRNWISICFIRKSTFLHIESCELNAHQCSCFRNRIVKANGTLQQTNDKIYPSTQCRPRYCINIACYTVPCLPLCALSCCEAVMQVNVFSLRITLNRFIVAFVALPFVPFLVRELRKAQRRAVTLRLPSRIQQKWTY